MHERQKHCLVMRCNITRMMSTCYTIYRRFLKAKVDSMKPKKLAPALPGCLTKIPIRACCQLASDGQLGQALKIYQSITKQLPYVHEAYWGIATVRHLQGDQERAREAME